MTTDLITTMKDNVTVGIVTRDYAPNEIEVLQSRLSKYTDEENQLLRLKQAYVPDIVEDAKQAGEVTDHIKSLKLLKSRIDDIHKKEKSPFWECCKAVDAWKNDFNNKIDSLITTASKPILEYNRKVEQEERQRQMQIAAKAKEDAEKLASEAMEHEAAGIIGTAHELMAAAIQEDTKADMIMNSSLDVTGRSRGLSATASNRRPWTGIVDSRAALDLEALRPYFSDDALDKAVKSAVRDGVRSIRGAVIFQDEKLSVR